MLVCKRQPKKILFVCLVVDVWVVVVWVVVIGLLLLFGLVTRLRIIENGMLHIMQVPEELSFAQTGAKMSSAFALPDREFVDQFSKDSDKAVTHSSRS